MADGLALLQFDHPVFGSYLTPNSDTSVGKVCGPQPGFGPSDLPMPGYHNGGFKGEDGIGRWQADVGQCRTQPIKISD